MEDILQKDIKALGKKGQKVSVSDGYGRNYLLPRNLAVEANASNINTMVTQDAAKAYHKQVELDAALEQKATLEGKTVSIKAKLGQNGKLFGTITSKEIADAVAEQLGISVDKKKISVSAPIKGEGSYTADVRLYADVACQITVKIIAE